MSAVTIFLLSIFFPLLAGIAFGYFYKITTDIIQSKKIINIAMSVLIIATLSLELSIKINVLIFNTALSLLIPIMAISCFAMGCFWVGFRRAMHLKIAAVPLKENIDKEELSNRNIGWGEVFWALFVGNKVIVRRHPILKNFLMTCAVLLTVFTPFQLHMLAKSYAGAVPPEAPVIKSTGVFVKKYRGPGVKNPYVDFLADNGSVYRSNVAPGELLALGEQEPPVKVYAEGFLLEDGKGSYWPLMVMSPDGQILLSKERANRILIRSKDPWTTGRFMYPFAILFWIITIYNAVQIKRIFSREL